MELMFKIVSLTAEPIKQKKSNLFMELYGFDVIKNVEEVALDGVGVRGLAQDF